MNSKRKVVVTKERYVHTYSEMWHTSYFLLEMGLEASKWSILHFRASLVFTAFTLEAYLNHVGEKVFLCWKDLERLSPKEKLNVIAEKLKIEVNYGKRPWQVVEELFKFRNDIAHGKTVKIKTKEVLPLEDLSNTKFYEQFLLTRWEKFCTQKNAVKAREDVKNIVATLHAAANFLDDLPFDSGHQIGGATAIE